MSSTLYFKSVPKEAHSLGSFYHPLKGILARKFYDHDGSLGGGEVYVTDVHRDWLEGVRDGGNWDYTDFEGLNKMIDLLEQGEAVVLWFEV